MSKPSVSDYPMEIIHKIISDVANLDYKTLFQCSLVSTAFYLSAREHIWRDITLDLHSTNVDQMFRLAGMCDWLQRPPSNPDLRPLVSLVRNVSISLPIPPQQSRVGLEDTDYVSRDIRPFVDLLHALGNIASSHGTGVLAFRVERHNLLWSHIPGPLRNALTQLARSPSIRTLYVENIHAIPRGFFTAAPALRALSLMGVGALTETDSLEISEDPTLISNKLQYLRIKNTTMEVHPGPQSSGTGGIQMVPSGKIIRTITDPETLRALDLTMPSWEGIPIPEGHSEVAIIGQHLRATPFCEDLTLRTTIKAIKDLPFHGLPSSLRHLTIIPCQRLRFYPLGAEWATYELQANQFSGWLYIDDDHGYDMSDALFVPKSFRAHTTNLTPLLLPRVTIHRPIAIHFPVYQGPTSNFVPAAVQFTNLLEGDPYPPVHHGCFWEAFARAVYRIPAVEVEIFLPIELAVVADTVGHPQDVLMDTSQEEAEICAEVTLAFERARVEAQGSMRDVEGPRVRLNVSAKFVDDD